MSVTIPIEKQYDSEGFAKFVEIEKCKPGNENNRYELIDGCIYMMGSPNMTHYNIADFIEQIFKRYFENKGCRVLHAPVDLFLFDKRRTKLVGLPKVKIKNVVVPDLMVVCSQTQIKNKGIYGAPELIVEVVSESNPENDYIRKLNAYHMFGIKEYCIVNPIKKNVRIYDLSIFNNPQEYNYTFENIVKSEIFSGLYVDFKQFTGFVVE